MGKIADAIAEGVSMSQTKRRQMLNLDEEFVALEAEVQVLRTEKRNLHAEVNPLKKTVERLEQRIKEQAAPRLTLDQTKEQMLKVLNENPRALTDLMAEAFDMTPEGAKYHLETMENAGFVRSGWNNHGEIWWLESGGREYLYKKRAFKMNNARKPSDADRARELEKLDLLPRGEGQKRANDLLRTLLSSPPEPFTPKPKAVKKRARKPAR